jgi:hypothetical protein
VKRYDPLKAPDPKRWLKVDENERLELVRVYHEKAKIELPNEMAHAAVHVIVENQLAGAEEAVVETFERLQREGLDRHEALHAIGSEVIQHMERLRRGGKSGSKPNQEYFDALGELSAKKWKKR